MDSDRRNSRRPVIGAVASFVEPTPVSDPQLVGWSEDVASLLKLPDQVPERGWLANVLGGNALLESMQPYAACYGGHQFGHWAGQLGDGRAISLGELVGRKGQSWELQLKGAGPTPYSRRGDGRAVLRSSIREFLCSESMHHLGVPTTRALSLVLTGESVLRDMFYDGHPEYEPGAIVCRVAPSFLRFGNFELFASRDDRVTLQCLIDYTLSRFYEGARDYCTQEPMSALVHWFEQVCQNTATLVAHWMRVGFVHGVMNTDNMSICGLTIDYGPYGWVDDYDLNWTPNTTDAQRRRYRFGHQANIAAWNLERLAEALAVSSDGDKGVFQSGLDVFRRTFERQSSHMLASKLGLLDLNIGRSAQQDRDSDAAFIQALQSVLTERAVDMTLFYRQLADVSMTEGGSAQQRSAPLRSAFYEAPLNEAYLKKLEDWLDVLARRVRTENQSPTRRREMMNRTNPKYVLRNYLAQQAIDKAQDGDFTMVHDLLDCLRSPYDAQPEYEHWYAKRPDWAKDKPGCSMLSCSS